jgi:hypothetical protein
MVNSEIKVFSVDELDVLSFASASEGQDGRSGATGVAAPDYQEPADDRGGGTMEVMLPAGTRIRAILLEDLDSGVHRRGHRFEAALGEDIKADGRVVAATGSRLVGRVTQVEKADVTRPMGKLVIELTGLYVDGLESLIATNTLEQSASADPAARAEQDRQRGARAGATIGALSGGSYAAVQRGAAIGGMMGWGAGEPVQAVIITNTMLEFRLRQELWLHLDR